MGARLLLVHSPLVAHATWDLVAADLAGRGYQVGVPDLTGTVAAGPPYCSRQAAVIAGSAAGEPAILIGHSGAGPLLAAAGALIGRVRGYVFADAGLPAPGAVLDGHRAARPGRPAAGDGRCPGLAAAVAALVGRAGPGRAPPRPRGAAGLHGRLPPAAAGHVRGGAPPGAALAGCARRVPAAQRGI